MSHHCSSLQAAPVLLQCMTDGCLPRDASAQVHRLPEPANQPRASSQLSALSRSVALATAISAPPSTTHCRVRQIWRAPKNGHISCVPHRSVRPCSLFSSPVFSQHGWDWRPGRGDGASEQQFGNSSGSNKRSTSLLWLMPVHAHQTITGLFSMYNH